MSARFVTGKSDGEDEVRPGRAPSSRGSWNTIKPSPKRGRPYATSLTLAFALTAVMTAFVLSAVLAYVWEGQFMAYTRQNMQSIADSTASAISLRPIAARCRVPSSVDKERSAVSGSRHPAAMMRFSRIITAPS